MRREKTRNVQEVITSGGIGRLPSVLHALGSQKHLLVCGSSFSHLGIKDVFDTCDVPYVTFRDFRPNPAYEDILKGVALFEKEHCDAIVAVGGGSAMDVAKCIKLFCKMDPNKDYLKQEMLDTGVPLIAVPTTAGSGSESTRYAVIYVNGNKYSVTHESIVPNYAILEPSVLKTLPLYQKKCTMLDALCQGIESWWSVNSTEESKTYAQIAVETIMAYKDAYLGENSDEANEKIMLASNYAGRAINITQTTAAHAMSYKLTTMYGLPHGHAVAVCLPLLWNHMRKNLAQCIDPRGAEYLGTIFSDIAHALGCPDCASAVEMFSQMLCELSVCSPAIKSEDLPVLAASVNMQRLKNTPVVLNETALLRLYTVMQHE